jgi:hypothetical protein
MPNLATQAAKTLVFAFWLEITLENVMLEDMLPRCKVHLFCQRFVPSFEKCAAMKIPKYEGRMLS